MADEQKPTKESEEEWPEKKEGGQNASETKVGKNCNMERLSSESQTANRSTISRAEKQ